MAFPFGFDSKLRQQFLVAIGTSGFLAAAAVGCTSQHTPIDGAGRGGRGGMTASSGAGSVAQGGAGSVASGGSGAVASAGKGGSGSGTPTMCTTGTAQRECYTPQTMKQKATFGCGMIATSPTPTDDEVKAKFLANGCLQRPSTCNGCCNRAQDEGEPQPDGSCCYTFCSGACCGRPFVVDDVPQLAAAERRRDWTAAFAPLAAHNLLSARIAAEWLEDARMEHASIASFARFTLDLLAYGAPAALVEAAQRAALDECEHAKLCFGLAARFGAGDFGPAQLPAAGATVAPSLWHAATAAFREGCVSETYSALQAAEACARATDPEVKRALERIAKDEANHAELAWSFVAWSSARLGNDFKAELRRELASLRAMPRPPANDTDSEPTSALNAAGRLTARDKARLDYTAVHAVIAPCVEALLSAELSAVS